MKFTKALAVLLLATVATSSNAKRFSGHYDDQQQSEEDRELLGDIEAAVVGGGEATEGEYPWFATPGVEATGVCGGSLISSKHVLTAAHCAESWKPPGAVRIGLFYNGNNDDLDESEEIDIKKWTEHPSYKLDDPASNTINDFAIVTLKEESSVTPVNIDLTGLSKSYTRDTKLWVMGVGFTKEGGGGEDFPDKLKHLEVAFVPKRICQAAFAGTPNYLLPSNTMCAASPGRPWEDSCQGDSGGPLFDKERGVQVGVVSYGPGCARQGVPGMYAKISDQAVWITETVCADYAPGEANRPDFCDSPIIPDPNYAPPPASSYTCSNKYATAVEFKLRTDSYPEQNEVTLSNTHTGETLGQLSFTPDDVDARVSSHTLNACIMPSPASGYACVNLTVTDSAEDGIIVPGGFELYMDGKELMWMYTNSTWSFKQETYLCAPAKKTPKKASKAKKSSKAAKASKKHKSVV